MSNLWRAITSIIATANLVAFATRSITATSSDPEKVSRIGGIEWSTPGTRSAALASAREAEKNILTLENNAISRPLHEGDTIFIISLVGSSTRDCFTFINENEAARGELRIAVAMEQLSADSDKWTPVNGAISFKRKRLFNVSMLGVEAKYIRLTFHVEHDSETSRVDTALVSR